MCELEDQVRGLPPMTEADRQAAVKKIEAQFDIRLRQLYAEVAKEYPGERKTTARPMVDPH